MSKVTVSHTNLLILLQKKESKNKKVTLEEILSATKWTRSSFLTYLNKGQFSQYLNQVDNISNTYTPTNCLDLTSSEFSRNLSQSKHRRELGHNCKSALAKALLKKSHENMLLALELYNRPSLENRLDSFVLCFCTSWDQLLKSILIERDGEKTIFETKPLPNGMRKTLPLRKCLDRFYDVQSPIKKNIERIIFYRDQAVHLLMPEIQGTISRVFQSGIMNYGKVFEKFSEQSFLPTSHTGMLSLVGDIENPSNTMIFAKYGKEYGKEILDLLNETSRETSEINDIEFAIPLNVKLIFAKDDDQGNMVILSKAEAGMEGLANAIIVEKPVDIQKTHPYRTREAEQEINRRLLSQYDIAALKNHLNSTRFDKTKVPISSYDFRVVCEKLKWKNSNNSKHHFHRNPDTHYFSDNAIIEFITKTMSNPQYLTRARESFKRNKIK